MITFFMVDVVGISSEIPRSNFSESELEVLADAILNSEGLLKPLILKKISFDQYQVVDGHFEYYAAVKAYEKNPRQAEMVNALVVSEDAESAISKQLEILAKEAPATTPSPARASQPVEPSKLDSRLSNLELRLEKLNNDLRNEISQGKESLERRISTLESQSKPPQDPLEQINSFSEGELATKLHRSRIPGWEKIAKSIIAARQKKPQQQFEDYRDVCNSVRGLAEKGMLTIIDDWSRR